MADNEEVNKSIAEIGLKDGSFRTFVITFKPGWSQWSYQSNALINYLDDLANGKTRKRKPSGVEDVRQVPIDRPLTDLELKILKRNEGIKD